MKGLEYPRINSIGLGQLPNAPGELAHPRGLTITTGNSAVRKPAISTLW